ncbi:hypothetical protein D8L93_06790 [Sodalis-like symbiont of Bactericera trigonica]|nr:hypothetical protein D8L93_06790 [Sodalis-like symbiont of Bactericera trigonica]
MDEFKSEDELKPDSSDRRRPASGERAYRAESASIQTAFDDRYRYFGAAVAGDKYWFSAEISGPNLFRPPGRADNNGQRNIDLSGSTSGSDASPSSLGATRR